jgi:hypothetical protein
MAGTTVVQTSKAFITMEPPPETSKYLSFSFFVAIIIFIRLFVGVLL